MPSPETSRENLQKANAKGCKPRPWRSPSESLIIRRLTWQWCAGYGPRCSGRELAQRLGVSHTHLQKLAREFAADFGTTLESTEYFVDGQLHVPYERCSATFEQLRAGQAETEKMREHHLLRLPCLWRRVECKIGDNVVRAVVPTKAYAAVLAAYNRFPPMW